MKGGLGVSLDTSKDAIFYMQGITFPSAPTRGCLFHLGGGRGLWVRINAQNKFEVYVRSSSHHRLISTNFPMDGQKHAVLVYIKTGVEGAEQGAIRVFIDCVEIREPVLFDALAATWADADSGSYLIQSSSGTPNGGWGQDAWPGGAEGAGQLNIYSSATEPALFAPFTPHVLLLASPRALAMPMRSPVLRSPALLAGTTSGAEKAATAPRLRPVT
eukprot:2748352-Rhodomonas_salina.1